MPIYEYECPKCGVFEATQRITDDPLRRCPSCRGKVRKLISSTSFQLKGSGWYVTDYARKDGAGKDGKSAKDTKDTKDTKSGESTAKEDTGKGGSEGKKEKKDAKASGAQAA
jgi:putative FmdB family regulatory protein